MADIAQLERALINADKAGDTQAAMTLAAEIRRIRSAPAGGVEQTEDSFADRAVKGTADVVGNLIAGGARGAGSIGATILAPWDIAKAALEGKGLTLENNRQRRAEIDAGWRAAGADPDSIAYQAGKLGGEVIGTAGAPAVLARGAASIPALAKLAPVIESGGFSLGRAATGKALPDMAMRAAGGAAQGGTQALMVDPEHAAKGAAIGAAAPGVIRAAGAAGNWAGEKAEAVARRLMQSALKPTEKMQRTGQADRAITTMLDEGINATRSGVDKMKASVDDINAEIAAALQGSNATVSKAKVASYLDDPRQAFGMQAAPTSDLAAIDAVGQDFLAHPLVSGPDMPVQLAQQLKQGTYRVLRGKYGEQGSAATEAQKALARGLKDEVATAVPGISGLNAHESDLINAIKVAERRAMMEANKNPAGLALIAPSKAALAAFLADRSGGLKSLAARGIHTAANPQLPAALVQALEQKGLLGIPSVVTASP